ncbi:hypothetical protein PV08_07479 [Exophiala spinifera]|uniref:Uncharacterized protein n=1 Tax=Exophiala spinifera TaxID=91928 RepID=A0A0D2B7N3_9EURO|nr:uncharacterized protein PV08_07479 [Exophiala spinifera]KIW14695.1 hypothetical protein PV08_07479 [Exophiala spinifera]
MSTAASVGLRPSPALTIPLISSSLTVFYAIIEPTIFLPFINAAKIDAPAANKTIRLWWNDYLPAGLVTIFSIGLTGVVGGINAATHFPHYSLSRKLCFAGAAFSAGHFAYGYHISQVIKSVCDEEEEKTGRTMDHVKTWLRVHLQRTLLTDLPALACFAWVAFGPQE